MISSRIDMQLRHILAIGFLALPAFAKADQPDTVRASVGRPIQHAESLIAAHDYKAALAALQKASAVGELTPFERAAIAQLRGAAQAGTGDYAQAASDYEQVLAAGTEPPAAQLAFTQAIAGFYFQATDYPHTITWVNRYIAAGGTDTQTRALLPQAYFQQGDYAGAEHAASQEVSFAARQNQIPPEAELQLLAYSAQKAGDQQGYFAALVALLQNDPSASTWNAAITTVANAADFPDALTFDVYRLRRATHTLTAPGDYEDYAERAILAGQLAEAKAVIDEGFSNGVLTESTDGGHAARLKTLADSGKAGTIAAAGPTDPLQQGVAQYQAGQPAQAIVSFDQLAATPGNNAQSSLAKLWAICARNAARAP
jgi:hypothetical protein